MNLPTRINILTNLKEDILKYEDEILNALNKDLNKCEFEGVATEVQYVLSEIDYILKKSDLEKRASERVKIEEVFKNGKNYNTAINFLRKQHFLPHQNIQDLISFQKDEQYPIGYIMVNRSNIVVGFVGTWFSKRRINSRENIFCNIHSWIVEQEYRLYSFYLISLLVIYGKFKFIKYNLSTNQLKKSC